MRVVMAVKNYNKGVMGKHIVVLYKSINNSWTNGILAYIYTAAHS
jgi:hypothetical protein